MILYSIRVSHILIKQFKIVKNVTLQYESGRGTICL